MLVLLALAAPASADNHAMVEKGHQVFHKWCAPCHAPGIKEYPGTVALYAKYHGRIPAALEQRTDLTAEVITYYVRHGVSVMPFFRKTEVSDKDLKALIAYLTRKH
jgi:mono/diheme cytochrome c family protein